MTTDKRIKLCAAGAAALCLMSHAVASASISDPAENLHGPITPITAPASPADSTSADNAPAPVQSQPAATTAGAGQQNSAQPSSKPPGEKKKDDVSYAQSKNNQAVPTHVSTAPVMPIHVEAYDAITEPEITTAPKSDVILPSMPLKGLISIDRRLSPFGLDAGYTEEIGLRDVLVTTLQRNLDISDVHALTQVQKFAYYRALSKYLPDAVLGYSLIGVDGTIRTPGGLFGGGNGLETLHITGAIYNCQCRFQATNI